MRQENNGVFCFTCFVKELNLTVYQTDRFVIYHRDLSQMELILYEPHFQVWLRTTASIKAIMLLLLVEIAVLRLLFCSSTNV